MKFIAWNCRGLGRPRAVRATIDLIRSYRPAILGLIETKLEVGAWDSLRVKLGYSNCFSVGRKGLGGGLALLWNDEVDVSLRSYSKAHIDVFVKAEIGFRLTLFYGDPRANRREESWNLLRRLKEGENDKWVVLGDFNEILYSAEMSGKRKRDNDQMRRFRQALLQCSLRDIGFSGPCFTFSNRRKGAEETRVRLDRVVANKHWMRSFPSANVLNGWALHSDHRPLILSLEKSLTHSTRNSLKTFRFEPMWMRDSNFKEVVKTVWMKVGNTSTNMANKLHACGKELAIWNNQKFGNVQRNIKNLKEYINKLQVEPRTSDVIEREEEASRKLDEWLAREELLWRQRSRTEWLKDGDRNTAFFRAKSTQRRDAKFINTLKTQDGEVVFSTDDILKGFADYFLGLFRAQEVLSEDFWEDVLNIVPKKVTTEMNRRLQEPYTVAEIRAALFQMHPTKAPGIDGFSALFYQSFWSSIKDDLCNDILSFLNEGVFDPTLNDTVIILVPKQKDPCGVGDYRPISLCTVLMKIITKVLANRLKSCLPEIISPSQTAFIQGRLISDNILIAHEVANVIKCKGRGLTGYLSLKIDMSKAFDRIEWTFMERMLLKLGFNHVWVNRVMTCVKTVSYRVKANGKMSRPIVPGRGLRQGDPISPYLFIICQEWLSLKLFKEQDVNRLRGIRVSRGFPLINHLFFADDCLLFLTADFHALRSLKQVLELYGKISGQELNYQKSEICASHNIDPFLQHLVGEYMGMNIIAQHTKYLGLPLIVGRRKIETFRWLEDRMMKKIQDWKSLLLSAAGKEALIKSCYLAVPVFAMSCYKVPKTFCEKLASNALTFWWSSNAKEKGIHWVKNVVLQKEKIKGGLGFRNLEAMNAAMLMKQLWRFLSQPDQLVSKLFRSRYFKDGLMANTRVKPNDSFAWRSLHSTLEIFKTGVELTGEPNGWRWKLAGGQGFTVKSAYSIAMNWIEAASNQYGEASNTEFVSKAWRSFWKIRLPERVKIMCWRAFYNALPVATNLRRRGCPTEQGCWFCGFKEETTCHIFLDCWWIKEFWRKMGLLLLTEQDFNSVADLLWFLMTEGHVSDLKKVMVGCWVVWYNRNLQAHGKKGMSLDGCCMRTQSALMQFERQFLLGYSAVEDSTESGDLVNIFCDGSWSPTSNVGGLAAVAVTGDTILCCRAEWYHNCVSVFDMECKAILAGLSLAKTHQWGLVSIRSDSSNGLWAIQTGAWHTEVFSQEAKEGMSLLAAHKEWSLNFIFREDNILADRLAKKARTDRWSWNAFDAIPRCLDAKRT
ncbi:unnamed protein product [Rhodiola kirilowii]